MYVEMRTTDEFDKWIKGLRDVRGRSHILRRLREIEFYGELFGDYKRLGNSLIELRFHMGPGYRVYLMQENDMLTILLVGGDKSSQKKDISRARKMVKELKKL